MSVAIVDIKLVREILDSRGKRSPNSRGVM